MRRRLITVIALVAAGGLLLTGVAVGEKAKLGNIELTVGGQVLPKKVSKKKWTPVKLKVNGKVRSDTGNLSDLPITNRIVVDFDKHGTIDTKGLPKCKLNKLVNTNTQQARRACPKSIVGKGRTSAWIDFDDEEQEPFEARGPLLAFYGKYQGKDAIIFHVFARVPLPTPFVVPAPITNAPGKKWGKRVTVKVPAIAGNNGTLTDFNVTIKKTWKHKRKKRSFLLAKCPDRKFTARAHVEWTEKGTGAPVGDLDIGVVRKCKGKK